MESNKNCATVSKRDEYCCVPLCNGNARIHHDLSFHHIPKNLEMRKKWLVAIRRDEGPQFKIGKNTVVCSRHFKEQDFRWTPNRKCLTKDAVPSIFDWTSTVRSRKMPLLRQPLITLHKDKNSAELDKIISDASDSEAENDEILEGNHSDKEDEVDNIHLSCQRKMRELQLLIEQKESEIKRKNEEFSDLQQKYHLERFGVTRFSFDDDLIEFYTGFPSYKVFSIFFSALRPIASRMKSVYYNSVDDVNIRGRPKSMDPIDELFMFLCRLKCGFLTEDLAVRFNIHASTVSRKIITWTNFLYFILGSINIWPEKERIQEHMPNDFQIQYPHTRVILDCTEIFTEKPSSLALASKTFSSYKSHNTWKGLVGIAPHGAVTFISSLYSGCISDLEITKYSGILDLLEPGDQIMADKGFVLDKLLKDGVTIATPHFLCSDGQFSTTQIQENQKIASLRIHVERHIKRVKEYRLLQSTVPLSIAGSINQLWTIANLLTLFRRPLIKQKN
ncbi:uncharacterized protein LOC134239942 [Saccostrea cucullata]|uniref:uncharacterized protein LOC134239942 n=1 Tax=Saccostrea cuccullata TaxID=36930 RepID=UPI002ED6A096